MKNNNLTTLSEKQIPVILWTLLCLSPLVGMVVDLVAPSLPAISAGLHVSQSVAQGVISLYLLGYALGNFFTGFLTDAWGRQKLLRIGLFGFVLASLAPVVFPTIQVLLMARFVQGLTIGGVAVIARAIYSDILPPEKLVRLGPLIGAMWGIGPVIGPVIGGYLQFYFGWQANFYFFGGLSFFMFLAIFIVVPETHFNRHPLQIKTMKENLMETLSHRMFLALILLMGVTYSLIIVFNTAGPFLIQTEFHYTPVFFGHLALCLGLVFLLSTLICRFFLKYYEVEQLFSVVINVLCILTLLLVIAGYFFPQSIILVATGSLLMYFGTGFIFPMAMGKGMSLFRHIAGTATAVMYLVNTLLTSLSSFAISFVTMHNAIPLMWVYFLLILLCTIIYWRLVHKHP